MYFYVLSFLKSHVLYLINTYQIKLLLLNFVHLITAIFYKMNFINTN